MTRQERGEMLVKEEETESAIENIESKLRSAAVTWKVLTAALEKGDFEHVYIKFAPGAKPINPMDATAMYASKTAPEWESLPSKEDIVQWTEELREHKSSLREIARTLGRRG